MKQFKPLFLFAMLMSMVGTRTFAHDCEVNGIYYNLDRLAKKATVTYYGTSNKSAQYSGMVYIPAEIWYDNDIYRVEEIGDSAFYKCKDLTYVKVLSTEDEDLDLDDYEVSNSSSKRTTIVLAYSCLKTVGNYAFYGCSNLSSIKFPYTIKTMGEWAFTGCDGLSSVHIDDLSAWCTIDFKDSYSNPLYYAKHLYVNNKELTDLVIPDNVTSIGKHAFTHCAGLTSVTMSDNVTYIGDDAFYLCENIGSLTLSQNLQEIGLFSFAFCNSLSSLVLPEGLRKMDNGVFCGCSKIDSVIIPNSVTELGACVFSHCYSLKYVRIGSGVRSIDNMVESGTFGRWKELTEITVDENNPVYDSRDNCNGIIESQSNTLVYGCKGTVIPYTVTSIGEYAYGECEDLTSVIIPESVTSIGSSAFYYTTLSSVTVKNTTPPSTENDTFYQSGHTTATLYVPFGCKEVYETAKNWKDFHEIIEMDEVVLKCASPTVNYVNGELSFSCETESVEFVYDIRTKTSGSESTDAKIALPITYTVSVYARKNGYADSDIVKQEIDIYGPKGDVNCDGKVDVEDVVTTVNIILNK